MKSLKSYLIYNTKVFAPVAVVMFFVTMIVEGIDRVLNIKFIALHLVIWGIGILGFSAYYYYKQKRTSIK